MTCTLVRFRPVEIFSVLSTNLLEPPPCPSYLLIIKAINQNEEDEEKKKKKEKENTTTMVEAFKLAVLYTLLSSSKRP